MPAKRTAAGFVEGTATVAGALRSDIAGDWRGLTFWRIARGCLTVDLGGDDAWSWFRPERR
jgi:hypothetical protein